MRIAINCRSILLPRRTGIGRYTYHLVDALAAMDHDDDYVLHAPKRLFDRKRRLPTFPPGRWQGRYDHWGRGITDCDAYHLPSPDRMVNYRGKLVVTVHDMIYKRYPKAHTPQTIALTQKYMEEIVRRADRIICVSEHTRKDLHAFFDYPPEQSVAILNGVDHTVFFALNDKRPALAFLQKHGIAREFILFVGTLEPRKNLAGLLEAMHYLKELRQPPLLVVAGMPGWMPDGLSSLIDNLGLKGHVLFLGFVHDEELNFLYNTCRIFVFPSFYEGFGFPIVEAFCAGACVAASKTASSSEVAGDAALPIDPADPKDMGRALMRLLSEPQLEHRLREKARARAHEFSFKRMATKTKDVYHS